MYAGAPGGRFTDGQLAAQFAGAFIHDAETVVIHRRACAPYSNTIVCNLNLDVTISQGLTANVNALGAGMFDGIEHCLTDQLQDVVALLKAGADGYLLKDTEPDMLLAQLADVMTGKQILSEPLRPYLENIYELDHLQQKLESLTRREMQIMREIAKGLSNKQVASVLHISEGTVKVHVKSLLKKLEAQSRVEAAVMYLEQRN